MRTGAKSPAHPGARATLSTPVPKWQKSLDEDGVDVRALVEWLLQWFPRPPESTRQTANSSARWKRRWKRLEEWSRDAQSGGLVEESEHLDAARRGLAIHAGFLDALSKPQVRESETIVCCMAVEAIRRATRGRSHYSEVAEAISLVCKEKGIPYSISEKALAGRVRRHIGSLRWPEAKYIPNLKKSQ